MNIAYRGLLEILLTDLAHIGLEQIVSDNEAENVVGLRMTSRNK